MSKIYDVIVLGAGPAGLAAGLYAGRSRLSVLIVEKGQDGGQIRTSWLPGGEWHHLLPEKSPHLLAQGREVSKDQDDGLAVMMNRKTMPP